MQKERILAYQMSKKLHEEDLKEISGGDCRVWASPPHNFPDTTCGGRDPRGPSDPGDDGDWNNWWR